MQHASWVQALSIALLPLHCLPVVFVCLLSLWLLVPGPAIVFGCKWSVVPAYILAELLGGILGSLISWPLYGVGNQLGRCAAAAPMAAQASAGQGTAGRQHCQMAKQRKQHANTESCVVVARSMPDPHILFRRPCFVLWQQGVCLILTSSSCAGLVQAGRAGEPACQTCHRQYSTCITWVMPLHRKGGDCAFAYLPLPVPYSLLPFLKSKQ